MWVILVVVSINVVHADCKLSASKKVTVTYNPVVDTTLIYSGLSFQVSNKKNTGCQYQAVLVEDGSDGMVNQPFQFYQEASATTLFSESNGFSGTIPGGPNQTNNHDYYAAVNLGWVAAGTYSDVHDVIIKSDNVIIERTNISLDVKVSSVGLLSVIESGGVFNSANTTKTLDFGELAQGKSQTFDVIVKTNAESYTLEYQSENKGVMAGELNNQETIAYDLYVNGSKVDLSNKVEVVSGGISINGARSTNSISIPEAVINKEPQRYSDTITIALKVK